MELINVFKEKIKVETLMELMRDNLRYSEILHNIGIRDSGKFNYHLKQLLKSELVEKEGEFYKLTKTGEQLSQYLKQYQLKEIYPIPVICLAIIKNNRILLAKKATKPIKGLWVLPGGRQLLGETIKQASIRECKDELGVECEFENILGVYPTIVKKIEQVSYHAYLIIVKVKLISGPRESFLKLQRKDISELKYFQIDKINFNKIAPSNRIIIKYIFSSKTKKFQFAEQNLKGDF